QRATLLEISRRIGGAAAPASGRFSSPKATRVRQFPTRVLPRTRMVTSVRSSSALLNPIPPTVETQFSMLQRPPDPYLHEVPSTFPLSTELRTDSDLAFELNGQP